MPDDLIEELDGDLIDDQPYCWECCASLVDSEDEVTDCGCFCSNACQTAYYADPGDSDE